MNSAKSFSFKKNKILVVDDERDNIRMLVHSLRNEYDMIAATSGAIALKKAAEEQPDLVLLDILMPDMDGYAVIRQLKAATETSEIPVIFITGLISPQDESKGLFMGAVDYIAKPFNMDVVRARIKTHLLIKRRHTDTTRARITAEARSRLMSTLVDSAPQYICYIDPNGHYGFVNAGAASITGYQNDRLLESGIDLLHDAESIARLRTHIIPALLEKGSMRFELPLIRADGEVRDLAFTAFVIQGEEHGIGAIATDITEQKRAQKALMEAKERAEQADRAKSEFLSRVSHELRTPLNIIIGMAAIARSTPDAGQVSKCMEKINTAAVHLTELVNGILDMVKLSAGDLEPAKECVDLKNLLNRIADAFQFRIMHKSQTLQLAPDKNLPSGVMTDPQYVMRILSSLLSNAHKFTPPGGTINLSVSCENESVRFAVTDNGIGITPEQMPHIFDTFEQGDGGRTRAYGGMGLGLATARRLAEKLGGHIGAVSLAGAGASFVLEFPAEICGNAANPPPSGINLTGHTLLVAEDIILNQEIIACILENTGASLVFAENGVKAVEQYKADPSGISLILMDINMPDMDGYAATHAIRDLENGTPHRIPIIAMTANTFAEDVAQCLAAGMDDHIGKPIDLDNLLLKLTRYING